MSPDLLLVAQNWEIYAGARDPLLPKTTATGESNVTWPQTSGNLFPSRKLKGNHTFTAQSTIVKSTRAEEGLSVKPEGEEEAESSAEEDAETSSRVSGTYHLFCQCSQAVIRGKIKIVSNVVVLTTS